MIFRESSKESSNSESDGGTPPIHEATQRLEKTMSRFFETKKKGGVSYEKGYSCWKAGGASFCKTLGTIPQNDFSCTFWIVVYLK